MNVPSREVPSASRDTILEQLGKILRSRLFQGSERSTSLLRYLVEEAVNGHTARLKEYTVATEALGKAASFDPRTDPVVRAEASRLRSRLEKYYATEGQADSLIFTLPKGSYIPRFETRLDLQSRGARPGTPRALPGRLAWSALGITVAVCVIMLLAWGVSRAPGPDSAVSIAVLPFANMSGDPSQEFFSDGITEEIISVLAKIPNLRVVARTSAFQFREKNRDIQSIGQTLNATHFIEGSVRKSGTRVRIAAQLIEARNGVNVWTQSYDRELTDVFAVQEEIAASIAGALHRQLGLAPGARLVLERPKDQETYDLYLRGRAALRSRTRQEAELLEQVVERDPNFAPGWALLSQASRVMALYFERLGEDSKVGPLVERAEVAARKAIELAPDYAGGYGALAAIRSDHLKHMEADDLFKQALARDPDDPEILSSYAAALFDLGYLRQALAARERVHLLEPLVPLFNRLRAVVIAANGNLDSGVTEGERLCSGCLLFLSPAYAQQGRFTEAADMLLHPPPEDSGFARPRIVGPFADPLISAAAQVMRAAAMRAEAPVKLPDFYSELSFVYAYTSTPERMLDWPEKDLQDGPRNQLSWVWWPTPSSVRKTQRFKTLVRNAGLVDYWRARGWPDLCRPVGAGDFTCD